MSALVHIRWCSTHCGSSSSVEFAMACLRRGFHNLSSSSSHRSTSTSLSSLSSPSSASLVGKYKVSKSDNDNNNYNNYASWCYSSGIRIPGARSFVSITDSRSSSSSSKKEVRKLNSSVDSRFCFTRSGSNLINHSPGLILGGERGGGEGEIGSRKNFVVITESSSSLQSLSLESSFGQVSGDLEQESEDASGDSFPRGTYESSSPHEHSAVHIHHDHTAVHDDHAHAHGHDHSALHGANTHDHHSGPYPTATITEVLDVGLMAELEDALGFPLGQRPQSPSPKPLVIVISGPSGVGKDAVIKKLQHARGDIHFVVTATTRAMRPTEVDGVDYHFMSKTEFQEMIENHELLEHAIVYGDYKGIPKQQVREFMSQGMDVVLRVDVQGAATVRSILGSEAVFIFLVAESEVALVKRLIERKTESMDKMLVRVATAREELTRMDEFDYVVVNEEGCLDRTVSLICNIIDAEKARVKPKSAEI